MKNVFCRKSLNSAFNVRNLLCPIGGGLPVEVVLWDDEISIGRSRGADSPARAAAAAAATPLLTYEAAGSFPPVNETSGCLIPATG